MSYARDKRRKRRAQQQREPDPPWTPFEAAVLQPLPLARQMRDLLDDNPDSVWRNSIYQVELRRVPASFSEDIDYITHLSVKRIDREPIGDWRVLQRIKNELLGEEVEAVELYPAESRLVDTSNQYHLWALPEGQRFPWGYQGRAVSERSFCGSKQRPFDADVRPDDLITEDPMALVERVKREIEEQEANDGGE